MNMGLVVRMAWRDVWHERMLSLCAVLSLATALAPLLLLLGVRSGVIEGMRERMLADPRNLEVVPAGSGKYGQDFFDAVRARADTGYLIPQTRAIAATIGLLPGEAAGGRLAPAPVTASLIPSGPGDPLIAHFSGDRRAFEAAFSGGVTGELPVILSAEAAEKLHAKKGSQVRGIVLRQRGGVPEQAELPLRVLEVLPLEAWTRPAAFAPLALLTAVEAYRDGKPFQLVEPEKTREYPSFRLYAANLEGVGSLRALLQGRGLEVYTKAEEIETIRRLDRASTLIFGLICLAAGIGFAASTVSSLSASVRRKQRLFGLLRLLGFSGVEVVLFPLVQNVLTTLVGTGVAFGIYAGIAAVINGIFTDTGAGAVCRIPLEQGLVMAGGVLLLALVASLFPGRAAARIQPSEVLRDV